MRDKLLLERAKSMRREMTTAELKLWLEIRARKVDGAKFRRQVVIGGYIADFACRTPTLIVVEVDGETHTGSETYDDARTAFLESRGYRVIRFTNSEVMKNLTGVLIAISEAIQTPPLRHRSAMPPLP